MKNECICMVVSTMSMVGLFLKSSNNLLVNVSNGLLQLEKWCDSVDRTVARSLAGSRARSLGRWRARSLGRSIARSVTRSVARSLTRSLARSLPRSIAPSLDRRRIVSWGRISSCRHDGELFRGSNCELQPRAIFISQVSELRFRRNYHRIF